MNCPHCGKGIVFTVEREYKMTKWDWALFISIMSFLLAFLFTCTPGGIYREAFENFLRY